jgi:hypothetical protein
MSEELAQLEFEAQQVDELNAPPNPEAIQQEQAAQEAQVNAETEKSELIGVLTITAALFTPMFPSLEKIYTPQTIQSIAAASVPVMQKHGWSAGSLLGKYGEEFALLAVCAPVAFATYKGVKADIEEAERKREEEEKKEKQQNEAESYTVVIPPPQDFEPQVQARG